MDELPVGFVSANMIYITYERAPFEEYIIEKMKQMSTDWYNNICHSISEIIIRSAIACPVNTMTAAECYKCLQNLRNALYCGQEIIGTYNTGINDTINKAIENINSIKLSGNINMNELCKWCNSMYFARNNVIYNLRPGNESWNKSIGKGFDPEEWFYVDNNRNVTSCYENILIDNAISYKNYDKFKDKVNIPGKGFYLTNSNDGIRCYYMKKTMGYEDEDTFGVIMAMTRNTEKSL